MPAKKPSGYRKTAQRRRRILRPEAVADALLKKRGNIAAVARLFGVTRQAVRQYVDSNPDLKDRENEGREERLDKAEEVLDRALDAGDMTAVYYTLSTLGKKRGYIRTDQIQGPGDGGRLPIEIYVPDNGRADATRVIPRRPEEAPDPDGPEASGAPGGPAVENP